MKKALVIIFMFLAISNDLFLTAAPRAKRLIRQFFAQEFLADQNLFDGRFVMGFKDQVNLTQDQIHKVENLMLTFEEQFIGRCAKIKIKEIHLANYIKSDQINRKKIEKIIRGISSERIEISILYLNYLLDIKMLLRSEQIGKLKKFKKNHFLKTKWPFDKHR